MSNKNDITLDTIKTKVPSDLYKSNWDKIFSQPAATPQEQPRGWQGITSQDLHRLTHRELPPWVEKLIFDVDNLLKERNT